MKRKYKILFIRKVDATPESTEQEMGLFLLTKKREDKA